MDAALSAGWLGQFLEAVIPGDFYKPIQECSQVSSIDTPCYDQPSGYEHLAPITWFGTLRLLVLGFTIQAVLMLLALGWDATASMLLLGKKRRAADMRYTPLDVVLDFLDVGLSLASCITFVARAQYGFSNPSSPAHRDSVMLVVFFVDWMIAGSVMSFYAINWHRAESKMRYVVSREPFLNILTITSTSFVAVIQEGWLPFTFLRSLTIHTALRRLFKVLDLPVLQEMLVLAVADFMALVFTMAGIIFMLENLGNPPGWEDGPEGKQNLSLMKAAWFVIVTVSTVGFGDISPVSFIGKIAGIVFIVVGVWFFSSSLGRISGLLQSQAEGRGRYSIGWGKSRHVVLTGDSVGSVQVRDFAKELLHCEHEEHAKAGTDLCCVAPATIDIERYLLQGELPAGRLQILRGSLPADLHRIAMHRANAIFFLGDVSHENPQAHDCELLLKAFTAHKYNEGCDVYMTLLAPESLQAASQGCRKPVTTLCTTAFKLGMLALTTFCPGVISLIGNLVTSVSSPDLASLTASAAEDTGRRQLTREYLYGLQQEIYKVSIPNEFQGQCFGELVLHIFKEYGVTLFALAKMKGDDEVECIAVHPGYRHVIEEDVAFAIANQNPQALIDNTIESFFTQLPEVSDHGDDKTDAHSPILYSPVQPESTKSAQVSGGAMGWGQNSAKGRNLDTADHPDANLAVADQQQLAQSIESMLEFRQRCRAPAARASASAVPHALPPAVGSAGSKLSLRRSGRVHPLPPAQSSLPLPPGFQPLPSEANTEAHHVSGAPYLPKAGANTGLDLYAPPPPPAPPEPLERVRGSEVGGGGEGLADASATPITCYGQAEGEKAHVNVSTSVARVCESWEETGESNQDLSEDNGKQHRRDALADSAPGEFGSSRLSKLAQSSVQGAARRRGAGDFVGGGSLPEAKVCASALPAPARR